MWPLLFLVGLSALPCLRFHGKGWQPNALSPRQTTAVKGIFTCVILISHSAYSYDILYLLEQHPNTAYFFDQRTVAPFLFFAGYAVGESIKNKATYRNGVPLKKIVLLYWRFAVINGLIILFSLLLGERYSPHFYLLSFLGLCKPLESRLGSCGWFVVILLLLYGITRLSFLLCKKRQTAALVLATILCSLLFGGLILLQAPDFWWNTLLLYPAGLWLSYKRDTILRLLARNNCRYLLVLAGCILCGGLTAFYYRRTANAVLFLLTSFLLMGCIILFLQKFTIGNRFLLFCGSHAFDIYLLQAIPMKLLELGEERLYPALYRAAPALHFLFETPEKINPYLYTLLAALLSFAAAFVFARLWSGVAQLTKNRKKRAA